MTAALQWIGNLFSGFWNAFLHALSSVVQFLIDVLTAVLNLAVDAFFWALTFIVGVLPSVPDLPGGSGGSLGNVLDLANYFFPVDVFLQGLTFLAAVYAGTELYKLAKLLRGGG